MKQSRHNTKLKEWKKTSRQNSKVKGRKNHLKFKTEYLSKRLRERETVPGGLGYNATCVA
jgi:hypothetical protein